MSVSSIGGPVPPVDPRKDKGVPKPDAERNPPVATPPGAVVNISPEARGIAELAAKGLFMASTRPGELPLSAQLSGTYRPPAAAVARDSITETQFVQMLRELGASEEQASQMLQDFDRDGNRTVSQSEFLGAVARTVSPGADVASQALLRLLDATGKRDGVVDQFEILNLNTAFAAKQRE